MTACWCLTRWLMFSNCFIASAPHVDSASRRKTDEIVLQRTRCTAFTPRVVNWSPQKPFCRLRQSINSATFASTVFCCFLQTWPPHCQCLTPSRPAVPNYCCSKGSVPYWSNPSVPYWSNPPFLIFDIRALWRSVLSARAPECQK